MTNEALKDKVLNWFGTGEVGESSKAMALHLCGVPCNGAYPHDPDDLRRCLLFLKVVPEARAMLPKMATLNKVWAALVQRWDEIEASYLHEDRVPLGSRFAHTFNLMQDVINSAR